MIGEYQAPPTTRNRCRSIAKTDVRVKKQLTQLLSFVSYHTRMFMGITAEGIQRELSATLESVALCRENGVKPLAIPNTAILKLAVLLTKTRNLPKASALLTKTRNLPKASALLTKTRNLPKASALQTKTRNLPEASALLFPSRKQLYPLRKDIVNGIFPHLQDVIHRETRSHVTGFFTVNDFSINPHNKFTFDPDGNDYYCKLCHSEIANQYYQCLGCLQHIHQEFNICYDCYEDADYRESVIMMPRTPSEDFKDLIDPERHHGPPPLDMVQCNEECIADELCDFCCHSTFQRHLRFYSDDCVTNLINIGNKVLVGDPVGDSDGVPFGDAAQMRDDEAVPDEAVPDEAVPDEAEPVVDPVVDAVVGDAVFRDAAV